MEEQEREAFVSELKGRIVGRILAEQSVDDLTDVGIMYQAGLIRGLRLALSYVEEMGQ